MTDDQLLARFGASNTPEPPFTVTGFGGLYRDANGDLVCLDLPSLPRRQIRCINENWRHHPGRRLIGF
jgi:hypothetical protein